MSERNLIDLARQIPFDAPSPEEARRLESQLYVRARLTPQHARPSAVARPSPVIWVAAASVLVALAAGGVLWGNELELRDERPYGLVRATEGASFVQELSTLGTHRKELVHLEDGTLFVSVRKLRGNDRFLVVSDDDEVEVRGTRFEVAARDGQLLRVTVEEGRVELRPKLGASRLLLAGDSWHRTRLGRAKRLLQRAAPEAPVPRTSKPQSSVQASLELGHTEPPVSSDPSPEDPIRVDILDELNAEREKPRHREKNRAKPEQVTPRLPRQDVEAAFLRAWQMQKRGQFEEAAELFLLVIDSGDEHDIVEDASYLRVIALESAGYPVEAIESAKRYLERFPQASRREVVELRWGWLEVGRGNAETARGLFERLGHSAHESIRAEAHRGIEALEKPPNSRWTDEGPE
jgi:tetratricopeptide (TPR) repeat protein